MKANGKFSLRPWGRFSTILKSCPSIKYWDYCGCAGPEDRSLIAYEVLSKSVKIPHSYVASILDPRSTYSDELLKLRSANIKKYLSLGGDSRDIREHELFEIEAILDTSIRKFLELCSENIILDISVYPKRFFFRLLKYFVNSEAIRNLIVTYTSPLKYGSGEIAQDYGDWRPLPMFHGRGLSEKHEFLFIGAGHMAMGLPDQIEAASGDVQLRIFFPFPGDPSSLNITWRFIQDLEKNLAQGRLKVKHLNARDVSDAFNYIAASTDNGEKTAIFAPYGPKPISTAMCLFSIATESPIYYTQPRVYSPQYSIGVATENGVPQIFAYAIKLAGENLYTVGIDKS